MAVSLVYLSKIQAALGGEDGRVIIKRGSFDGAGSSVVAVLPSQKPP